MFVDMNKGNGLYLFNRCKATYAEKHFPDMGDFLETLGIWPDILDNYINGRSVMLDEHLERFAQFLHISKDELAKDLEREYKAYYAHLAEEKKAEEEREKRAQEFALECEAKEQRLVKISEIEEELKEYGIDRVVTYSDQYPISEYYLLKFVMRFIEKEEYLPKLKALLKTHRDEELIHGGTTALMWAADSLFSYELLLMLADRKDFISKHIEDRGYEGKTALDYYVHQSIAVPDGIDLLVEWGADVNSKDDLLWTPLHFAAASHNDVLYRRLYKLGAIVCQNKRGDTPSDITDRDEAIDAW